MYMKIVHMLLSQKLSLYGYIPRFQAGICMRR